MRILTAFVFLSFHLSAASGNPDLMRQEIKHIVVVMLENRSFDNLLGWLYSEDPPLQFIPSENPLPFQGLSDSLAKAFANPLQNSMGNFVYSCLPVKGVPSSGVSEWLNSPPYDPNEPFSNVSKQIFGMGGMTVPTMLGFVQDYASLWAENEWERDRLNICSVMESYTDKQLPVFTSLARHYAVSDFWFSSVPTQTNPNRAFSVCGTSEGQIVNGFLGKSVFNADTIWNRWEEIGSSWTIFWQSDMLPVIFPGPFHTSRMFPSMGAIPNLESHYQKIDAFHELARNGGLPEFSFIEPQWTFCEGVELEELKKICPDTDYLAGLQGNDFHPPGDVRTAENFLANIYTSLIANQEAWEKTLLVVLFDEHGGIFDHIPPPSAVAPDTHFENGFMFDRYGVRTPALFISPRIKKGTVLRPDSSATPFDHTSLIATLLKWKQMDPSQWNMGKRTAIAPTFEAVVTENIARNDAAIGDLEEDPEVLRDCPRTISGSDSAGLFDELSMDGELAYAESAIADERSSERSQKGPEDDPLRVCGQSLNMGETVLLKDPNGSYLSVYLGEFSCIDECEKAIPIQFSPSGGAITHGSFVTIQWQNDPANRILDSSSLIGDCCFAENSHSPNQWWTVKSVDHPFLGSGIKLGDRIYLESHVYTDPLTFVPARLAVDSCSIWEGSVITKSIADADADSCYWTVERLP